MWHTTNLTRDINIFLKKIKKIKTKNFKKILKIQKIQKPRS